MTMIAQAVEALRIHSTIPTEILIEVARAIFFEPRRYNQGIWGTPRAAEDGYMDLTPPCGTVCCIAGWVAVGKRKRKEQPEDVLSAERICTDWIPARARRILKLTAEQADVLFDGDAVRRRLRKQGKADVWLRLDLNVDHGTEAYAHAGIRHIESFMRKEMGYRGPKLLPMFKREQKALAGAAK